MSYSTPSFATVLDSFQLDPQNNILDGKTIRRAFADADCEFGYAENAVFDRETTLWAILHEMIHTGTERTLKAAVQAVQQKRIAEGKAPNSANTGAYSAARGKINAEVPTSLFQTVARNAELSLPNDMLWNGLQVTNLDGSSDSMPDTEENRTKYSRTKYQKPGLSFPLRRYVALISVVTAMVQMVAFGPWCGKGNGEMGLLVSLFDRLKQCSNWIQVLVADRYYCSYFTIAILAHFGIRFVTRLHGSRLVDFANAEKVKRQTNGDWHVTWKRPFRPHWMPDWMWEIVPATMTLRLVRVHIETKGARTKGFFVITNLLDAEKYDSDSIRDLYRGRWHIEVDLRTIKIFMSLDILRGRTPKMVELEFSTGLLAYNLVRMKMLETTIGVRRNSQRKNTVEKKGKATKNKIEPKDLTTRHVSFSVAMTSIAVSYVTFLFMNDGQRRICLEQGERNRASVQVGNRLDRSEPRVNKRRPKVRHLMQEPREKLREKLLRGESWTQSGDEAAAMLGEK